MPPVLNSGTYVEEGGANSSFVDQKSSFVDQKSSFLDPKYSFVVPKSTLDVDNY
jgi:hypothetical protein